MPLPPSLVVLDLLDLLAFLIIQAIPANVAAQATPTAFLAFLAFVVSGILALRGVQAFCLSCCPGFLPFLLSGQFLLMWPLRPHRLHGAAVHVAKFCPSPPRNVHFGGAFFASSRLSGGEEKTTVRS